MNDEVHVEMYPNKLTILSHPSSHLKYTIVPLTNLLLFLVLSAIFTNENADILMMNVYLIHSTNGKISTSMPTTFRCQTQTEITSLHKVQMQFLI